MIRRNRHIIVALLITNLLVSNIGLSINWMYCFCKGQMQVSLFDLKDDCEKEVKNHTTCCETEQCDKTEIFPSQKSCCSKFAKYKKSTEKPCTSKGKKYFKADLKFFLSEKEEKKSKVIDFQIVKTNVLFENQAPTVVSKQLLSSLPTHAPPPRIYGRELLVFVQNFRC